MTGEDFWIFSKNGVLRKNRAVFYHILTKNLLESGIRRRLRPVRVPAEGTVRGGSRDLRHNFAVPAPQNGADVRMAAGPLRHPRRGTARKLPKGREKHRFPIGKRCFCGRGEQHGPAAGRYGLPPASLAAAPAARFVFSEHETAEGPEAGRLRSGRSRGVRIRSGEGPGRRRREGRPYQRIRSQRARVPPIRTARSAAPRTVSRNEERDVHPLAPRRP